MKLFLILSIFSVFLLANSLTQNSFGMTDYEELGKWGSLGTQPGKFVNPLQIGVGEDGSVYVNDLGTKRIQKFQSSGNYTLDWGSSGKQAGGFHYPAGIAVSGDSVFVADRDLHRIQKFSLDGEFVLEWGQKGGYDGQLFFPNDIAIYNDTLYVVDTGNQRIQVFSTDGEFLSSFGSSGLGDGQFVAPVAITIDSDGNVYVTDRGNNKIEQFTFDGIFVRSLAYYYNEYVFSPGAITVDPNGELFVVNVANGRILHLSPDAGLLLTPVQTIGPYPDSFVTISDIEIGINGELLIADSSTHKIQVFETAFYESEDSIPYFEPVIEKEVFDQTKPQITAPESLIVEATGRLTSVYIGNATATDDSGIKAIINNAPELFSPGISNVIWIAFDNSGHTSTAYQTVNVVACGKNASDYYLIEGTEDDDVLAGTDGDDLIFGLSGDDMISGGSGNDCIYGGSGNDTISGNDGDDVLKGNSGDDVLKGDAGTDILYSHAGSDVLDGGAYLDRCYPYSVTDVLVSCEE